MARAVSQAPSTIDRIWQAFGLQPHRLKTFKLSADPLFVEKVRDFVGLVALSHANILSSRLRKFVFRRGR